MKGYFRLNHKDRKLFTTWAFINCLTVVFLGAMAIVYGHKIHGPSLVIIPVILVVAAGASAFAGRICFELGERVTPKRKEHLLHKAKWLTFWAWVTPMIGILGTVFGFWKLLTGGGSNSDIHARVQSGGGVALIGTFVGVVCSVVITGIHRMIEHELED